MVFGRAAPGGRRGGLRRRHRRAAGLRGRRALRGDLSRAVRRREAQDRGYIRGRGRRDQAPHVAGGLRVGVVRERPLRTTPILALPPSRTSSPSGRRGRRGRVPCGRSRRMGTRADPPQGQPSSGAPGARRTPRRTRGKPAGSRSCGAPLSRLGWAIYTAANRDATGRLRPASQLLNPPLTVLSSGRPSSPVDCMSLGTMRGGVFMHSGVEAVGFVWRGPDCLGGYEGGGVVFLHTDGRHRFCPCGGRLDEDVEPATERHYRLVIPEDLRGTSLHHQLEWREGGGETEATSGGGRVRHVSIICDN